MLCHCYRGSTTEITAAVRGALCSAGAILLLLLPPRSFSTHFLMLFGGYVALALALPADTVAVTALASPDTSTLILLLPAAGGASAKPLNV